MLFPCLIGCQKSSSANAKYLNAAELAKAQNIYWWRVQLPRDLKSTDSVYVGYVFPDGHTEPKISSTGGFKAGEEVKVFCWQDHSRDILMTAIITSHSTMHISLKNYLKDSKISTCPVEIGTLGQPGDFLFKFTSKDSLTGETTYSENGGFLDFIMGRARSSLAAPAVPHVKGGKLEDGEMGIALLIKKKE